MIKLITVKLRNRKVLLRCNLITNREDEPFIEIGITFIYYHKIYNFIINDFDTKERFYSFLEKFHIVHDHDQKWGITWYNGDDNRICTISDSQIENVLTTFIQDCFGYLDYLLIVRGNQILSYCHLAIVNNCGTKRTTYDHYIKSIIQRNVFRSLLISYPEVFFDDWSCYELRRKNRFKTISMIDKKHVLL